MTREIDYDAADAIQLNGDSLDVALDRATEANWAGLEPQIQLVVAIKGYLQAERERTDLLRVPEPYREKIQALLALSNEDWMRMRAYFPEDMKRLARILDAAAPR
jgi:hypothetical protein